VDSVDLCIRRLSVGPSVWETRSMTLDKDWYSPIPFLGHESGVSGRRDNTN
jgi:hypothetical protein